MSVKVKDNGAEALLARVDKLNNTMTVRVGIMGSKALEAKRHREGPGETAGLTVVDVAESHEFGIGVPRRSFIRDYHDQNQVDIKKEMVKRAKFIWDGKPVKQQLNRLGEHILDGIVTRIETGIPPANSQETIDRKGSETPLIDTGQLKSSIDYEVDDGRS